MGMFYVRARSSTCPASPWPHPPGLLWLFGSLVALHFHHCLGKPHCWTVDFDIGALHHKLNLGLDMLDMLDMPAASYFLLP